MNYTTLWLLLAFVALGIIIRLLKRFTLRHDDTESAGIASKSAGLASESAEPASLRPAASDDSECCGQHAVCEKESLLATKADIVYFNDEELDVLSGRDPQTYTEEELDMLEEVFSTLRESEVVEWLKSMQLRRIQLPDTLRDEALMIVSERRTQA